MRILWHTDFLGGVAFSQGQTQILWQGSIFAIKFIFRGRNSIFARSNTNCVIGATISQGEEEIL